MQSGSPNSVIIRWRTDTAVNSVVKYGISTGSLTSQAENFELTTEHEIKLSSLAANTKYYYSVGSSTEDLASGPMYFFLTGPQEGTPKKTRVWVIGDSGTDDDDQRNVRDSYYSFTGTTETNLWVMLGDNAYDDGTDEEYQDAVFEVYDDLLRNSVLWPAFGNHDGHSAESPTESGPFYDIFSLPANAEAGGLASGTEAYYSFNYSNIHFICLNLEDINGFLYDEMFDWLQSDLAQNKLTWTVAFWHHPPYSKGSHDSDDSSSLRRMREKALPILENGGVDLVLTGHSHSYERSYLLDGHYDDSETLSSEMILDNGDGNVNGDGAYQKPSLGPASHEGAVYIVAGSSGKTSGGDLDHPAMYLSLNVLGSVVLDFDNSELNITFLNDSAEILDQFTMQKGTNSSQPRPPLNINIRP